jgi:hypothetical protein
VDSIVGGVLRSRNVGVSFHFNEPFGTAGIGTTIPASLEAINGWIT